MRRIPIRVKLAAALAVPLLALAALTSRQVVNTSRAVDDIREQTDLARAAIGPAGLITTLQNERTWALVELIGFESVLTVQTEGYDQTRADTDNSLAAFQEEVSSQGGRIAEAYGPALDGLGEEVQRIRADIDAFTAPRSLSNIDFARSIFERLTELVEPVFDATTRVAYDVDDAELRQGALLADTVARQIETMSQMLIEAVADAIVSPGGVDQPEEISLISALHGDFDHQNQTMLSATGTYRDIAEERFPTELVDNADAIVEEAISTSRIGDIAAVQASMNVPREEGFVGYQEAVHAAINDRADGLNSTAEARRLWLSALAVLALLAAAVLTWVVSRSITRPLRSLTLQATRMADHGLPDAVLDILETPLGDDVEVPSVEPIAVRTRDEVADVAGALNVVQDSALDLAVEQAVLRRNIADSFVNLGRRNQNLLGRQLDFITELESNETDPDTLASLFRLDHLATRMRRNAESLLVLGGIDPPRKWAAPVRLTDVIRAALGEVEDYQRVSLRSVEPATVVGSAAADLAHLLAELIENALTFSPPDRAVDVMGGHHQDGGYSLAVIDSGFGMPPEDIAQANRRLAGSESFTVAPSKYLGHYVAGNLAARHGILIQLRESPGAGTTATVDLPANLLTAESARGAVTTDPRDTRARARVPHAAGPAPAAPAGPMPMDPHRWGPPARPDTAPDTGLPARLDREGGGPPARPGTPDAPTPAGPAPAAPAWPGPMDPRGGGSPAWLDMAGDTGGPAPASRADPAERATTAGGLARRERLQPARAGGPGPAPIPSGDLLKALQAHTRNAGPAPGEDRAAAGPAGAGPAPTTPGGLVRRVKGAQMPSTEPLSLRRSAADASRAAATGGAAAHPGPPPGGNSAAQDVYGLLSSFTSGVQRGLDESRRPPNT